MASGKRILDISTVDLSHMQVNKEAILDSWEREAILLAGTEIPQRRRHG